MTVDELSEAVFLLPPSEKKALLRDALARAHAEGLEAGLRQAAQEAMAARERVREEPAIRDDGKRHSVMAALYGFSLRLIEMAEGPRSLIPAAPEVTK